MVDDRSYPVPMDDILSPRQTAEGAQKGGPRAACVVGQGGRGDGEGFTSAGSMTWRQMADTRHSQRVQAYINGARMGRRHCIGCRYRPLAVTGWEDVDVVGWYAEHWSPPPACWLRRWRPEDSCWVR